MQGVIFLTPHFAVTGALGRDDLANVAAQGFKSVLSNLPDGELRQHPSAAEEAELAGRAGLAFRHVPAIKSEIFGDQVVEGVSEALAALQGPILAHCASGIRSAIAWAAAAARSQPADCVLAALKGAGFELAAMREELEDQHGLPHARPIPACSGLPLRPVLTARAEQCCCLTGCYGCRRRTVCRRCSCTRTD